MPGRGSVALRMARVQQTQRIAGNRAAQRMVQRIDATSISRKPGNLPTHTAELFQAAVTRAVELLRAGEVVALPTETVYGLAANALDPKAVARLFEIKKNHPSLSFSRSLSFSFAAMAVLHW